MNWEDIRLFLTLARDGSARGAGASEGISHSTIKRRVELLEAELGVRLFDRDVRGYRLTGAGETMLESVLRAEDAFLGAQRKLQGRDTQLRGEIRLTTSDIIATRLIMDDLVAFGDEYPDINLTILISHDLFDLNRREADVALRMLRLGSSPPEHLVGRKLVTIKGCYYASKEYLAKNDPWKEDSSARWIGWNEAKPFPAWVRTSPFPNLSAQNGLDDLNLQAEAARCGMGLTVLPCFFGDKIEGLQRIPKCEPSESYDLWILSHPDLRDTARLRVFRTFLIDTIKRRNRELTGDIKLSVG